MQRLFVQSRLFSARIRERADAVALLAAIEFAILRDPHCGDVVPGLAGVRKMRISDSVRQKGKRGGIRVLYLDLPERDHTHLLWLYDKDESDDISPEGRKTIRSLVDEVKRGKA